MSPVLSDERGLCARAHPRDAVARRDVPLAALRDREWPTGPSPKDRISFHASGGRTFDPAEKKREEAMGACGKIAAACIPAIVLGILGSLSQGAARAAELVVVSGQGATPGVKELAAAFARTSGHKVTVVQEAGAALDQRLANGPADLIAGSPVQIADLVKMGKVVAGTVTPFALA